MGFIVWDNATFGCQKSCRVLLSHVLRTNTGRGYYLVYLAVDGVARGCWKGTNKDVIVEYLSVEDTRETACAAI